ncbi:unnamed protein product, partial [Effrenium voratum]
ALCVVIARTPRWAFQGRRCGNTSLQRNLQELGRRISIEVNPDSSKNGGTGSALLRSAERLPPKSSIFVNMVKTEVDHFKDVADTTRLLADEGYEPIPHMPVSRLSTAEEFHGTLDMLTEAGARQLLLVGGNDLRQRNAQNELRFRNVSALLKAEAKSMKAAGIQTVALAGLPDSPPWPGWDEKVATRVLLEKVRLVLEAGLKAEVASQFCFNPRQLVHWLRETATALEAEGLHGVTFRVGVAGPTRLKRLRRIAEICEVPADFLHPGMFDLALGGHDRVAAEGLEDAGLGLSQRDLSPFAGEDGCLGRPELACALAEVEGGFEVPAERSQTGNGSGPSVFVECQEDSEEELVIPKDLLYVLAACDGNLAVNLYPFGGLTQSLSMAKSLRAGEPL